MVEHKPKYFAYLLRLWRADGEEEPVWRASLQRPGEEERCGFGSLEELFAFLCSLTGLGAVPATPAPDDEEEAARAKPA